MSQYQCFDTSRIRLRPLAERINDLAGNILLPLRSPERLTCPELQNAAVAMQKAKHTGASTLFLCGGHVIRSGVQNYLFDMMKKGFIQGIAVNGSVAIHDYEIALQNATTESVATYIRNGQFGLWAETGHVNDIVRQGNEKRLGFGEALGQAIAEGPFPHKDKSLFATAWRLGIPVTVHVGIGYDIIHEHPNFDAASTGAASYRDFLIFAQLLTKLEGGVLGCFGSAVMGPEVFLKALSMVRNVAKQNGNQISHFTTLVCDLLDLPETNPSYVPSRQDARYYFRPWKTLLVRTVADGGHSLYIKGRHENTIPELWHYLQQEDS